MFLNSPNLFRSGAREKEALHDRPYESSEVGSFERAQKSRRGPTLISRLQAQSSGLMARPVSIASTVGGTRRAPNTSAGSVGDRALDDDVDSSTHRHRRRFIDSPTSTSSSRGNQLCEFKFSELGATSAVAGFW